MVSIRYTCIQSLPPEFDGRLCQAVSEVLVNWKRLKNLGRNEAETRYTICNPLMSMGCDCYNYELKLEAQASDVPLPLLCFSG